MKREFVCACALALMLCHVTCAYDKKFGELNMPAILNSTLLHITVNQCLLGSVDCGQTWNEFRETAKEIFKTRCSKCSPKEKFVVKMYTDFTRKKFPETWRAIVDMLKS